jgi:hypothetical protein
MPRAEQYEATINKVIANYGGDVRNALKALIVANEFLENLVVELDEQARAVSEARAA